MEREKSSVLFSFYPKANKSSYHDVCVKNALPPASGDKAQVEVDVVGQAEIWKQAVTKEVASVKEWETNWGFLTEYDAKGNKKEPKPIPDNLTIFSDTVPNTNAGNYGSQVSSGVGQNLQDLEFKFYAERRRRKMGADMVCY